MTEQNIQGKKNKDVGKKAEEVHSLTEIRTESVRGLEDVPEWEELIMTVDSGAGATVVNDSMIKAVTAKNPRPDVKYEVADGSHIPNMGEKTFAAFTDGGVLRSMTAQVTEVNKALLSVAKLVSTGHRAVFDPQLSYIEHCETGEWMPLEENNGTFALRLWIHKDQSSPF